MDSRGGARTSERYFAAPHEGDTALPCAASSSRAGLLACHHDGWEIQADVMLAAADMEEGPVDGLATSV
jgi:hypothetical protein